MKSAFKMAAIAALSVGIAGEAFAQAATQDVNITATVLPYCLINGLAAGTAIANPVTVLASGIVSTAPGNHTVSNVACNVAASVQTSTANGAVTTATAAGTGFQNTFDYSASATFGTATSTINTTTVGAGGTGTAQSTAAAHTGNLAIAVTPIANTLPLVAGSYADTLTVTLTPTP